MRPGFKHATFGFPDLPEREVGSLLIPLTGYQKCITYGLNTLMISLHSGVYRTEEQLQWSFPYLFMASIYGSMN